MKKIILIPFLFLITFGCDPGEKEIEVKTMTASVNGWKADPYLGDSMFLNGSLRMYQKTGLRFRMHNGCRWVMVHGLVSHLMTRH
jgi:hypothetical protein